MKSKLNCHTTFSNAYFQAKIQLFQNFNGQYGEESQEGYSHIIFSDILILRDPNHRKITHEIVGRWWITILGQRVPQIKKLKKTDSKTDI